MQELRKGTQVKVRIGPFVDKTDGLTPETGITLSAADEAELLKHDGAATVDISGRTWAAVAGCDGWYDLTLTISDTDTFGQLTVVVQDDSVCLPVFRDFMVVAQNHWDLKYTSNSKYEKALKSLNQALELDATHEPTLLNKVKALFTLDRQTEALALAPALEKSEDSTIANDASALITAYK